MVFSADQVSGGSRWPLVRVSLGGVTEVVSLQSRFLPLSVHWIGTSVVCAGEGCPLCEMLPLRGVFYLCVSCLGRTSLLELASQSSAHLEQHAKVLHGGLAPGHVIRLSRRGAKSPVYSEIIDTRVGVRCVDMLMVASRAMALYHLPGANPGEEFEDYQTRLQPIVMLRARKEAIAFRKRSEAGV